MFGSKSDREKNIDQLIGALLRAHGARQQAEPDGSSPFLSQRILARIEEERRQRTEDGLTWGVLFREGLQVIPLLTLIAIFIMGLAITTRSSSQLVHSSTAPAVPHALTSGDIAPFSEDEMLASATVVEDRNGK
jgi:hypothetical protein